MHESLSVTTLILGELNTNCYLAWCSDTREALIIDPADSAETITSEIIQLELQPLAIVLTHGHFDHILGTLELKLNFGIPILAHMADLFLLKSSSSRSEHWLKRKTDPVPQPDAFLREGQILEVGTCSLRVLETPGHTPGSISLFDATGHILFTGDTLFADGVGRTDFSYSSPHELKQSVHRLLSLPENTTVYPGHGDSAYLGSLLHNS